MKRNKNLGQWWFGAVAILVGCGEQVPLEVGGPLPQTLYTAQPPLLSHSRTLDAGGQLNCTGADLDALSVEAAANGGTAEAELTLKTFESLQFDGAGGCVRGIYEVVEA